MTPIRPPIELRLSGSALRGAPVLVAAVGIAMAGYLIGPLGMPAVVLRLVIVGALIGALAAGRIEGAFAATK